MSGKLVRICGIIFRLTGIELTNFSNSGKNKPKGGKEIFEFLAIFSIDKNYQRIVLCSLTPKLVSTLPAHKITNHKLQKTIVFSVLHALLKMFIRAYNFKINNNEKFHYLLM